MATFIEIADNFVLPSAEFVLLTIYKGAYGAPSADVRAVGPWQNHLGAHVEFNQRQMQVPEALVTSQDRATKAQINAVYVRLQGVLWRQGWGTLLRP